MCWVVMHLELCDIFLEKRTKIMGVFKNVHGIHVYVMFNLNLQEIEKKKDFAHAILKL